MKLKRIPFNKLVRDYTSKFKKIPKANYLDSGEFPIIDQGSKFISGYSQNKELISEFDYPVIIFGDHTRVFKYVDFPFILGADGTKVLKGESNLVNQKFLYYLLRSLRIPNAGYSRHFKFLKNKTLHIPEKKSDQQKIAQLLGRVEKLIQERKASIDLLDELVKSTFLDMFGDPVRNEKGWETKSITQLVKRVKHSIKRGPFGGALKKEIFVNEGYLVYEQYHALNDDFSFGRYFIDESKFNELKAFEVSPGDIIISCSGVYRGKLAIIPKNAKKGIINQALLKLSLDNEIINSNYFVELFRNKSFTTKFLGNNRGSGVPNFPPMSEFKKFQFITPPKSLQDKYSDALFSINQLRSLNERSLEELEQLFAALSQQAYKGELDVSKVKLDDKAITAERIAYNTGAQDLNKQSLTRKESKKEKVSSKEESEPDSKWKYSRTIGASVQSKIPFNSAEGKEVLSAAFSKKEYGFRFDEFESFLEKERFSFTYEQTRDFIFQKLEEGNLEQLYIAEDFIDFGEEADPKKHNQGDRGKVYLKVVKS